MRSLNSTALALGLAAALAGCGGGSTVPAGLVLTWNANGTSGNQYQTLHLATGATATVTVTQDATRQNFTAFLSGGPPNGTAEGAGPPSPSSACAAFSLDTTNSAVAHTIASVASGSCYLVAQDASLAYTQLLVSNP